MICLESHKPIPVPPSGCRVRAKQGTAKRFWDSVAIICHRHVHIISPPVVCACGFRHPEPATLACYLRPRRDRGGTDEKFTATRSSSAHKVTLRPSPRPKPATPTDRLLEMNLPIITAVSMRRCGTDEITTICAVVSVHWGLFRLSYIKTL
jgi:hypothetical protein